MTSVQALCLLWHCRDDLFSAGDFAGGGCVQQRWGHLCSGSVFAVRDPEKGWFVVSFLVWSNLKCHHWNVTMKGSRNSRMCVNANYCDSVDGRVCCLNLSTDMLILWLPWVYFYQDVSYHLYIVWSFATFNKRRRRKRRMIIHNKQDLQSICDLSWVPVSLFTEWLLLLLLPHLPRKPNGYWLQSH